jgi:hypothetical protein
MDTQGSQAAAGKYSWQAAAAGEAGKRPAATQG